MKIFLTHSNHSKTKNMDIEKGHTEIEFHSNSKPI